MAATLRSITDMTSAVDSPFAAPESTPTNFSTVAISAVSLPGAMRARSFISASVRPRARLPQKPPSIPASASTA